MRHGADPALGFILRSFDLKDLPPSFHMEVTFPFLGALTAEAHRYELRPLMVAPGVVDVQAIRWSPPGTTPSIMYVPAEDREGLFPLLRLSEPKPGIQGSNVHRVWAPCLVDVPEALRKLAIPITPREAQ